MKLENQVCNLELAKRLKRLGVKQESLWYWRETKISKEDSDSKLVRNKKEDIGFEVIPTLMTREDISAFTVAELGEMLPERIEIKEESRIFSKRVRLATLYWEINSFRVLGNRTGNNGKHEVGYFMGDSRMVAESLRYLDDNEANARAKMLVHLIENELITLKKGG